MALDDYARMVSPVPFGPGRTPWGYAFGPEHNFYPLTAPPPAPPPTTDTPAVEEGPTGIFQSTSTGLPYDRDSATRSSDTGPGGHSANMGVNAMSMGGGENDWLAVAPGAMSVPMTGLSYGTGVAQSGRMHDAGVWNPGDMIGSILGGVTGIPGAGMLAGMAGEALSPSYVAQDYGGMTENGQSVYAQDVLHDPEAYQDYLSSREVGAAEDAMGSVPWMSSPMGANPIPVTQGGYRGFTPTEAARRAFAGWSRGAGMPAGWQPTGVSRMSATPPQVRSGGQATAAQSSGSQGGFGYTGGYGYGANPGQSPQYDSASRALENMGQSRLDAIDRALDRAFRDNPDAFAI